MNFSAFNHSLICRTTLLCFLFFFLPACSFFAKNEPEAAVLEQRTKALIDVGWSWLHAENVRLLRASWQGERYIGIFEYEIVSDVEMGLLPEFEKERFSIFLAMCEGRMINIGSRCHVLESISFIETDEYGWMPELSLHLGKEQLAFISENREKTVRK